MPGELPNPSSSKAVHASKPHVREGWLDSRMVRSFRWWMVAWIGWSMLVPLLHHPILIE